MEASRRLRFSLATEALMGRTPIPLGTRWLVALAAIVLTGWACAGPAQPGGGSPAAGTAAPAAPEMPAPGGVLHFPIRQSMDTLDPYAGFGFSPLALGWPRYEPLVIFKRSPATDHRIDFEVLPWLAERWEQKGPTTYVFSLRQGVKWHDGEEFTADDVAFTIKTVNDPQNRYFYRRYADQIAEAKALDRYTVQLQLKKEDVGLFSNLTWLYILPKHLIDRGESLAKVSVGTGPFKLKDFDSRSGFTFTRNPDYWDKPRPYVEGIVGHYGLDDAGMLAGFVSQQLDILTVETNQLEVVKRAVPDVQVNRFIADYGNSLYFKTDKAPYSDPRVRRALHLVLDREAMFQTISRGQGVINPPGINGQKQGYALSQQDLLKLPGYNPATKQQDIVEAKRLLAEAGYPNGFSDKLLFPKSASTTAPIAEMAVTQIKNALGIDLTLDGTDAAVYQQRDAKGEYNVQMGLLISMDTNLRDRFHSKSPTNTAKIADPELDRLIETFDATGDLEKRRGLARDVQKLLLEKLYAVPTIETPFFPVNQPWVRNFNFGYGNPHAAPYWLASDTWIDVKKLPPARSNETPRLAGR